MTTNRRNFIKNTSIISGGLALSYALPAALMGNTTAAEELAFEPNLLMKLGSDGIVQFNYTRHEMGQGSFTGLSMIFANELGAAWDKIEAKQVDFDLKYDPHHTSTTGGSNTIRSMWQPLRELAAAARIMLIQAAAKEWKVDTKECIAEESKVTHSLSGRKVGFGELAEKAKLIPVPKELVFKDPKDYKIVGQAKKNLNLDRIINANLPYSLDVKIPNMTYAAIARSPIYLGKIKSFDDSEAKKVNGYIGTIPIQKSAVGVIDDFSTMREGLAVLATNTWAAFEAKKRLKIEWEGDLSTVNTDDLTQIRIEAKDKKSDIISFDTGEVNSRLKNATKTFSRSYQNPYQVHALMEVPSATADVQGNKCEVWSSVQNVKRVLERTGQAVNLPVKAFTFHNLSCGGSFGRRFYDDFVTEAVYLSKTANRPVKVVWSREDEISTSGYHSNQEESHEIGLDAAGNITAWKQRTYRAAPESELSWMFPVNPYFNAHRVHEMIGVQAQLPIMAWRSVDAHQNALGLECFMDELANELNQDPLQFRLDLMNKHEYPTTINNPDYEWAAEGARDMLIPKAKKVFGRIQQLEDWTKPLPVGHGRGVAGHLFGRTFAGHLAEVSVENGQLQIHKITSVVDCGMVINPHQATGQIEGGIIWGLSALFYNNITVKNGRVEQSNFHDYPILRMDKTPEIEVIFIESEAAPLGVGEPGVPPVAPAVLNAIYAATGKRIRHIPVTSEDLIDI